MVCARLNVRDNNDYCYSTFRETGCAAGCRHPDDCHDAARHLYRRCPPARHHSTGLWLKHGANRPPHDAAPAGLRLDLSSCRRRRPAPGHGAQPFYRSAADLHRDWRTFAAVGLAVVYRYGDRGLRNCAGQCPVTRINQTRFPGPGRKTHGGVFADDGGRRCRRIGADRPAVAGECWLARGAVDADVLPAGGAAAVVTAMAQQTNRHPDRSGRVAQSGYLALRPRLAGDAFSGH